MCRSTSNHVTDLRGVRSMLELVDIQSWVSSCLCGLLQARLGITSSRAPLWINQSGWKEQLVGRQWPFSFTASAVTMHDACGPRLVESSDNALSIVSFGHLTTGFWNRYARQLRRGLRLVFKSFNLGSKDASSCCCCTMFGSCPVTQPAAIAGAKNSRVRGPPTFLGVTMHISSGTSLRDVSQDSVILWVINRCPGRPLTPYLSAL